MAETSSLLAKAAADDNPAVDELVELDWIVEGAGALSTARVRWHRQMLVVALAVLVLAGCLQVLPGGRVAFIGLAAYPVPPSCMSWELFGIRCPGCGLTRSFVHLAHGDWRASLAVQPVGWVLMLAVVAQLPYRGWIVCTRREPLRQVYRTAFAWSILALLFANWAIYMLNRP